MMKAFSITGKISSIILCALLMLSLGGCREDLIQSSYQATDSLIEQAKPPLNPDQPILIASFVNIDNLDETSTLGRSISECIGTRLTQQGHKVIEMKLRKSVFMKKESGEFLLSRDLRHISKAHNVQAIIVGTYSVGKNVVYITAKLVNLNDNTALASYAYRLRIGENIRTMLGMGMY